MESEFKWPALQPFSTPFLREFRVRMDQQQQHRNICQGQTPIWFKDVRFLIAGRVYSL